jgi:hypothetical protein
MTTTIKVMCNNNYYNGTFVFLNYSNTMVNVTFVTYSQNVASTHAETITNNDHQPVDGI